MTVSNTVEYCNLAQSKYQPNDADHIPGPPHAQRIYIYKNHDNVADFMPTERLVDGLRNALEQYPIVAAKLVILENGDIEVHSPDKGILYKESHSGRDISEFNPKWPQNEVQREWEAVPESQAAKDAPLTDFNRFADIPCMIHVTRFANNSGVVVCLSGHHIVGDGYSWTMFLRAWAAFTRGETPPPPLHDRDILRLPKEQRHLVNLPQAETFKRFMEVFKIIQRRDIMVHISSEKLVQLKQDAIASLSDEERSTDWFSTMDVLVMMLWRSLARARQWPDDEMITEVSAVNMRYRLRDLPKNYFGNAIEAPNVDISMGELCRQSLGTLAIRHRHRYDGREYEHPHEWIIHANTGEIMSSLNRNGFMKYGLDISCTDWTKFDYYAQMDFGYGGP
ncbi:transferase [Syncephalis plumigaleata]|nr:transferase [Syncephalis plumigaleata]